jgi:hypothetical protein
MSKEHDDNFGVDIESAEGWRPTDPGDSVIGTLVEADLGWSDWMNDRQGGSYPILTVQQDDGSPRNVHCFQAVLYRRVMTLRPQIGERIKFVYHGKKERPDKTTVAMFTVRVAGRTQTSVYEQLAGVSTTDVASAAPPEVT